MTDDEKIYVTTAEDMVAYDQLPPGLKKFLDESVEGMPAVPVLEFYKQKLAGCTPLYSDAEVQQMVINAIQEVSRRRGFKDFRPVVAKPGAKKHRERLIRLPKKLFRVGDGG
jgi:hypothetical protein